MIVRSDQINCYIEGVKIPIFEFTSNYVRDKLGHASIIVPVGGVIVPKMWANAFIQITCILEENGSRKEKLLFQGLCVNLNVAEEHGKIQIQAVSLWDSLNLNTTLDYVSPNRYGLKNMQEGIVIYVGTEATVTPEIQTGYKLSERFFYVDQEEDIKTMDYDDPEALKLQFLADRAPFAERYAFSLFEDLSYENFLLSRSYIDRFNLLSKSKRSSAEEVKFVSENVIGVVSADFERINLAKKYMYSGKSGSGNTAGTQDSPSINGSDIKSSGLNALYVIAHSWNPSITQKFYKVKQLSDIFRLGGGNISQAINAVEKSSNKTNGDCIILLGLNDVGTANAVQQALKNMQTLIDKIRNKGLTGNIFVCNISAAENYSNISNCKSFNSSLSQLKNCSIIDIYTYIKEQKYTFTSDKFHLTNWTGLGNFLAKMVDK
jgi:hypothetical protein